MKKVAIITPAYNEGPFLPEVIESIANQTLRPVKWVIVDDRSTDNTWEVIQNYCAKYDFIEGVRIEGDHERRVGSNVVHVFNKGLERIQFAYDFVVKMDADTVLKPEYFEEILKYFDADPTLGMASGKTYIKVGEEWELERIPDTHVSGACKIYKRECFEAIGGLYPLLGWDILDGVKARFKGFKTRSFADMPLYHLRKSGSARGMIRARFRTGLAMYTIRANPLFVVGKSLYRATEKPYLSALLIPVGYFCSYFTKNPRLPDLDVAAFLRKEQLGRVSGKSLRNEALFSKKIVE